MRTPTPAQLLQIWERGESSVAVRCLWLLGISWDGADAAALPLGRRDALLLQLRARLFGTDINAIANCPQCGAAVEATFECDDLLTTTEADDPAAAALEHVSSVDGLRVRFRVPDSTDLLALESCSDVEVARRLLLERCVREAESRLGAFDVQDLPIDVQTEIAQAMAAADPQADLQLALSCPQCGHAWQPMFDIAHYLWQELHAWALRMLRDIDTLARVYHWSEADILALSPWRRQAYLELCAS